MMRIDVDAGRCQGHARCLAVAPDLYELDDEGYNQMGQVDIPAGQESAALSGAEACPEGAIHVLD
jgi:ferredoxin